MGLPGNLIDIIMHCVSGARLNILWNGSCSLEVELERGIRQGDPMSPYLFVLCMDKLSHLITVAVDDGDWIPLCARSGPPVSDLKFADDLLFSGKATKEQMDMVLTVLDVVCYYLGQEVISGEKTNIFSLKMSALLCQIYLRSNLVSLRLLALESTLEFL